jgi:hypothetical protein
MHLNQTERQEFAAQIQQVRLQFVNDALGEAGLPSWFYGRSAGFKHGGRKEKLRLDLSVIRHKFVEGCPPRFRRASGGRL